MSEHRLGRWVSVLANSSVLIGLILVFLQMNQNEELVRLQILNQYHDNYIAHESSFAGENLTAIWQKAAEVPQELSLVEMRAMESQTFAPILPWINLYQLAAAGIVDEAFWRGPDVGYQESGNGWSKRPSPYRHDGTVWPKISDATEFRRLANA